MCDSCLLLHISTNIYNTKLSPEINESLQHVPLLMSKVYICTLYMFYFNIHTHRQYIKYIIKYTHSQIYIFSDLILIYYNIFKYNIIM